MECQTEESENDEDDDRISDCTSVQVRLEFMEMLIAQVGGSNLSIKNAKLIQDFGDLERRISSL